MKFGVWTWHRLITTIYNVLQQYRKDSTSVKNQPKSGRPQKRPILSKQIRKSLENPKLNSTQLLRKNFTRLEKRSLLVYGFVYIYQQKPTQNKNNVMSSKTKICILIKWLRWIHIHSYCWVHFSAYKNKTCKLLHKLYCSGEIDHHFAVLYAGVLWVYGKNFTGQLFWAFLVKNVT